jgi:photosystem II stability/assembly factor-like uncharacterized protein
MRYLLSVLLTFSCLGAVPAADWQPLAHDLVAQEKPGFGGLCGLLVDHATGHVYVNLSDRGLYRSTNQGRTWEQLGKPFRGRTEWPGCLLLDPTGKSKRLLVALVYGAPLTLGTLDGGDWKTLQPKSSHIDWAAIDWTDPDPGLILALKHESGGLLLQSRDGGRSFTEVGKGYGPAWVFDGSTAVVAGLKNKERPRPGLLRTSDSGKTFQPAGDYTATALPKWHKDTLYWLVDGALLTTTDKGENWKKLAEIKDGRYGPIFGKDDKHLFVLTGGGIITSTDGGASWSKPIAMPKELKGGSALTWIDYDPVHDLLYTMKMGSDLFQMPLGGK